MLKKLFFNIVIIIILLMLGMAIIKANKPKQGIMKGNLNDIEKETGLAPREAKYYRVIKE